MGTPPWKMGKIGDFAWLYDVSWIEDGDLCETPATFHPFSRVWWSLTGLEPRENGDFTTRNAELPIFEIPWGMNADTQERDLNQEEMVFWAMNMNISMVNQHELPNIPALLAMNGWLVQSQGLLLSKHLVTCAEVPMGQIFKITRTVFLPPSKGQKTTRSFGNDMVDSDIIEYLTILDPLITHKLLACYTHPSRSWGWCWSWQVIWFFFMACGLGWWCPVGLGKLHLDGVLVRRHDQRYSAKTCSCIDIITYWYILKHT